MPLVILGIIFIVGYSFEVLGEGMPEVFQRVVDVVLLFTWVVFFVDYVVRVVLSGRGHRWQFVRTNVVDLLSVILPVFRALRVVNLLRRIPYFHVKSPAAVRTEVIAFAFAYAVLFVYFLALATLHVEQHAPGATITTFGDAVWWAIVTIATVGYGDTYPVTILGRVYAVILMIGGIAIIGTASALIISFVTERVTSRMRSPGGPS